MTPAPSPDEPVSAAPQVRRPSRRWWRLLVILLPGLLLLLLWLNGPGFRWLTPPVVRHWLGKHGMACDFTVRGTLVGGFSLQHISLSGKPVLGKLSADLVSHDATLVSLLRRQPFRLTVRALHADLDLPETDVVAAGREPDPGSGIPSFDPAAYQSRLAAVHGWLEWASIDVSDVQLKLNRAGRPWLHLAPSSLRHQAGTSELQLALGGLTGPDLKTWPSQQSRVTLSPNSLRIDQLSPLPELTLRGTELEFPPDSAEPPLLRTTVRWMHAEMAVAVWPSSGTARIDLNDGEIDLSRVVAGLALRQPLQGVVDSLSLDLANLLPNPRQATGSLQLAARSVVWDSFPAADTLVFDAFLDSAQLKVRADVAGLGTRASLAAACPLLRQPDGGLSLGPLSGTLDVPDVHRAWLAAMRSLPQTLPSQPIPEAPEASLAVRFAISPTPMQPHQIESQWSIDPVRRDEVAPLALDFRCTLPSGFDAILTAPNWRCEANYHAITRCYRANAAASGLDSRSIAPWLKLARFQFPDSALIDASWDGKGDLRNHTHQGVLDLRKLNWSRPGLPTAEAKSKIDYEWPVQASARGIQLATADHVLIADIAATPSQVRVSEGRWSHAGLELAKFHGVLPTTDAESAPVDVTCKAGPIPLAVLQPWLAALPESAKKPLAAVDPSATCQLDVQVGGTISTPQLNASLDVLGLRDQLRRVPPADLRLKLATRDATADLTGSFALAGIPPATLCAGMRFLPHAWLADPAALLREPVNAQVDLPGVPLQRLMAWMPQLSQAEGQLKGNLSAKGQLGSPAVLGNLTLQASRLAWKSADLPEVRNLSGNIEFRPGEVSLRSLHATLAAGSLDAAGAVRLTADQPPQLDFRLTGRHLPIRRDASLILRSHADLRLAGPWNRATLSGSVNVVDSLFFRDIEILPLGTPFTLPSAASLPKIDSAARQVPPLPKPFGDWALDLRATTRNPFLIRGNIATGQIEADLRVGGTLSAPRPDGTATLSDFTAALPFSTLRVRRGIARFTPDGGFDPSLEIRGVAEPRPYRVDAYLYGRASNPQLVLTSNPPMPENEIMTLLATGTTTSGLENPAAASSRALQLFAEELRRGRTSIGKPLRPLLGLFDRVDFSLDEEDPYSGDSLSTATITLSDRWLLSAGMANEGGSRLLAIWRITFR